MKRRACCCSSLPIIAKIFIVPSSCVALRKCSTCSAPTRTCRTATRTAASTAKEENSDATAVKASQLTCMT
jgi:hypothetical protein